MHGTRQAPVLAACAEAPGVGGRRRRGIRAVDAPRAVSGGRTLDCEGSGAGHVQLVSSRSGHEAGRRSRPEQRLGRLCAVRPGPMLPGFTRLESPHPPLGSARNRRIARLAIRRRIGMMGSGFVHRTGRGGDGRGIRESSDGAPQHSRLQAAAGAARSAGGSDRDGDSVAVVDEHPTVAPLRADGRAARQDSQRQHRTQSRGRRAIARNPLARPTRASTGSGRSTSRCSSFRRWASSGTTPRGGRTG